MGEMALSECGVADRDALAVLRLTGVQLADRFRDRRSDQDHLPGEQLQINNTDEELAGVARELIELMPYEWADSANSSPSISIRTTRMGDSLGLYRSTGEIVATRDALRGSVAAGLGWRVVQFNSPLTDCIDVQRADERDWGQPYGPAGRAGLYIGFLLSGDLGLLDMIGTAFAAYGSLSLVAGAWIQACHRQRFGCRLPTDAELPELGSQRWMDEFAKAMMEFHPPSHPSPKALEMADRLLAELIPGWQHDSPLAMLHLTARGRGIPDAWITSVADLLQRERDAAAIEEGLSSDTADILSMTGRLQRLLDEEQRDDDWAYRMRLLMGAALLEGRRGALSVPGQAD